MNSLNHPDRFSELKKILEKKKSLRALYAEYYERFANSLKNCPQGKILEIGSGASFIKEFIPEAITSDLIAYPGIDQVVDATKLPFEDRTLKAIFLCNVLHHIQDAETFFAEANRCLVAGGKLFIIDQYPGLISKPILKFLHHETYDDKTRSWAFKSSGPLTGANGALPWIIFKRDREKLTKLYPEFKIAEEHTHTPLRYWLCGGLRRWTLLPLRFFPLVTWIDKKLVELSPNWGSFIEIQMTRVN